MTRLILLLTLALSACQFEVPVDTIRPIDEYCFEGLCGADQKCWRGECYDQCASDAECGEGCCAKGEGTETLYCAPSEVCE